MNFERDAFMTLLVEIVNRGPDTETTERLTEAASPDRIELLCRGLSLSTLSPFVEKIMAIEPYEFNVPETAIERLRQRLATTDLPDGSTPFDFPFIQFPRNSNHGLLVSTALQTLSPECRRSLCSDPISTPGPLAATSRKHLHRE